MLKDLEILLVDDDHIDQKSFQRAFSELKVKNRLVIMNNGEDALAYLKKPDKNPIGLIILDLNMPRLNGIEMLTVLKNDENLMLIPVVVVSTSPEKKDLFECYRLGVAGYMVKPVDYSYFLEIVHAIDVYWSYNLTPATFLKSR